MTPCADFVCASCGHRETLEWGRGEAPPTATDAPCPFCEVIAPLKRDWSAPMIGRGSSGGTPSRS